MANDTPAGANRVGQNMLRTDGPAKLTGRALYVDDIQIPGCLHGATVRSPVAHGILRGIRPDPAYDWSDVVIVTAADIPGENVVALMTDDHDDRRPARPRLRPHPARR